jgi:molecular chaperone GrpE (heat shock protein)
MSSIVQAIPNANANSEETASTTAGRDANNQAINEAMVAALTAQVAELNERVARGLARLDELRSTNARRTDPGNHPPDGTTKNPGPITLSAW